MKIMDHVTFEEKARELRRLGLSFRKISLIVGIPQETIYGWIAYNKKPNRPRNQKISPTAGILSEDFSYVMGVMWGDGSIVTTINTIKLSVKDFDFCEVFKNTLEKWSGIKCTSIKLRNDGLWTVSLSSREACNLIQKFQLESLLNAKPSIQASLLRGLFDSEGSVSASRLDIPKFSTRKVKLYNTDRTLIEICQFILKRFGIEAPIYHYKARPNSNIKSKKDLHVLQISNQANLTRFYKSIGFSIRRKQELLERIVKSYTKLPNNDIPIQNHG